MSGLNIGDVAIAYANGMLLNGGIKEEHMTEFFVWINERDQHLIERGINIAEGRLTGQPVGKW